MTIEFTCHECQHKLRTSDDKAGRTAACPSCGIQLTVPSPKGGQSEFDAFDDDDYGEPSSSFPSPSSSSRGGAGKKECPMCGASVSRSASRCPDCGEELSSRPRRKKRARYSEPHRGGLILGLAIGGFLCCCFVTIAALVMGHQDLSAMKEGRMDPDGHGLTLAGVIIAWIGLGINIIIAIFNVLVTLAQG